jgi:hypothetical protein
MANWSDEPSAALASIASPVTAESLLEAGDGTLLFLFSLQKEFHRKMPFINPNQWFELDPAASDEELEGQVYWKVENTLQTTVSTVLGTVVLEWDVSLKIGA